MKGIYSRLFQKIVDMINLKINSYGTCRKIGVLDIYGFESFEKNSFEQFVINYSNEKLHQLFINLTLKSEQDMYASQEIEWEHVEFFNNLPICELIEKKSTGIISLLNEETNRPGEPTDLTFLEKLDSHFVKNEFYDSYAKTKNDKRLVMRIECLLCKSCMVNCRH